MSIENDCGNVKTQDLSGDYQIYFDNTYNLPFKYDYDRSNRLIRSYLNAFNSHRLENTYDKDGNILTLIRYDGYNTQLDNFNYTYYTGTNKLRRVYDTTNQYLYDFNGNLTKDTINSISGIKYDNRNLITQLSSFKGARMYVVYFDYDETGNRYAKTVYRFTGLGLPAEEPERSDVSISSDWTLQYFEIYGRDISGRILAIYRDGEIVEYPVYGLDNIGKISGDVPHYYMKDHLGSIRATVDIDLNVISAQDYDAWGYVLDGRSYESNLERFKFTGKERDIETKYDYFGARYYDARIGNWGSVDPLMEKHFDFSPYNYVLRNPLRLIDPDGNQVVPYLLMGDTPKEGRINFTENRHVQELSTGHIVSLVNGPTESGAISDELGLLDPVDWISGSAVTMSMRISAKMSMTATEKLVQRTLKAYEKSTVSKTRDIGREWVLGTFKSETKWANQLSTRGWTTEQITEALKSGKSFAAINKVNKTNKATRYVHPKTGKSVVIDNVTKEILHIGKSGFDY